MIPAPTRRALFTGLALALLFASCSESRGASTLRFTAIPNEKTTELHAKFAPLAKYLSESLGVPVEYVPATDYGASVELFKNGDVHLAWFGGLTGVRARSAVEGARAIAQGKVDPEYKSYFIANVETGLRPSEAFPAALRGLSFTFGSSGSTSGRLMPEHFIREHTEQSPAEFFGAEMSFSGSHDKTAELVQAGTFQAGALDYMTYDRLVAEGKIDGAKCPVIWVTPPYADYQWTAHPEVDEIFGPGFTERLQTSLVDMREPELLEAVNRPGGLILATNADFEAIRDLAVRNGLLR